MNTTTTGDNLNFNSYNGTITITPTKESIVERLLHEKQISLQEALILLKEIHNHYPTINQPWTFPYIPYNPSYWPTITCTTKDF